MALAQRKLTASLDEVLRVENLVATEWFTLNALGLRGPELPSSNLIGLVATNGLDADQAEVLLDRMAARGLVERDGSGDAGLVRLTPEGQSRYTETRSRIQVQTAATFGRFDPARVEAARALLQDIAELDGDQITASGRPESNQQHS
jgi:DNA-binding MarR family transcriptional regulator